MILAGCGPTWVHCGRRQARIQGGDQGGLGPPPHKKLLPQIVKRGSRGAKMALAPPPPPGDQEGLGPPPPLQNPGSAYGRCGMMGVD